MSSPFYEPPLGIGDTVRAPWSDPDHSIVADLKTAIERVRALHVAETGVWTLCRECTNGEEVVLWPCPTIQTLDGTAPAEWATITITQEDE